MAQSQSVFHSDDIHPIDVVESVASQREWQFDRLADDEIAMVIEGQWRSYSLTLAWSAREEVLRLICTFDLDPPAGRIPQLYELLNLVNDQVWDGGFTFWAPEKLMAWRYGLVLTGDHIAGPEQIDQMIASAFEGCERFYPSFQLVAWGDSAPKDAVNIAITEAYGRA
ncbi:MAG: diacylglyceryl transferase [Paracoccus denitrificans]|nr:MAG: diacylglyceryl transferase [Paracoccus denitrificans]PZO82941.1 MAG: diacylglyceryl transferase [Paracoccus denitrificans]